MNIKQMVRIHNVVNAKLTDSQYEQLTDIAIDDSHMVADLMRYMKAKQRMKARQQKVE